MITYVQAVSHSSYVSAISPEGEGRVRASRMYERVDVHPRPALRQRPDDDCRNEF
jgi:hypothetical protein